jgi:uncharacterized membrane protein (UPF0127 family)
VSPRLAIALAITVVIVVLSALGAWILRSSIDTRAAVEFGAIDTTAAASVPFEGFTQARIALEDSCLLVAVADEIDERTRGLRDATDLGTYDGMLFVFPADTDARFTMAGTPLTLDIGWYDADGLPVDRTTMEPCLYGDDATCPDYGATRKYRYALETHGGQLGGGALGGCSS